MNQGDASKKYLIHGAENGPAMRMSITDTTDPKLSDAALREIAERFIRAFEHAPIGIAVVSLDGSFINVNRSLCNLVGYSEAELLAISVKELTHQDDFELHKHNGSFDMNQSFLQKPFTPGQLAAKVRHVLDSRD